MLTLFWAVDKIAKLDGLFGVVSDEVNEYTAASLGIPTKLSELMPAIITEYLNPVINGNPVSVALVIVTVVLDDAGIIF